LLQNILRPCVKIILIDSTITNGSLKQHRATVQIPERNNTTCILVESTI
jgi:hypothetical protein